MRLDNIERNALEKAIKDINGEVYLFGSRVENRKRGGDIDILILSDEDPLKISQKVSINFFLECEEKIDVIVINPNKVTKEQQAFLNQIKMERIN